MVTPITFRMPDAPRTLIVQFDEGPGVKSKKAVAVLVAYDDKKVIASTGFDAHACAIFPMVFALGSVLAGRLFRNKKCVGEISIGNDSSGLPWLRVQVDSIDHAVRLCASDIVSLKEMFCEIGGGDE